MFKLAVCIPVYNRVELFGVCLKKILNEIERNELSDTIQVVISDNASADNIQHVIQEAYTKYPNTNIKYNRNSMNKGMAYNFLKVVELSNAEFCWIIGADDFLKEESLSKIIDLLYTHDDISFISVAYSQIELSRVGKKNLLEILNDSKNILPHKAPIHSGVIDKWDYLVDPQYNNVLLGAVMTGIFKKKLWDSADKSDIKFGNSFSDLKNTYPHCYIYAQNMIGQKAYYFGEPLIIVGNGAREWATDTGNSYWNSYLPLIQLKLIDDMILEYEKNGLDAEQVHKCRSWSGKTVGYIILPYIIRSKILKKKMLRGEEINIFDIFNLHKWNISFYRSIIFSVPRLIYLKLRIFFKKIMHGGAL